MVETLVFTTPNDGGSCKFFNHPILISSGNHPIGQHRCQAPEKCSVSPKLLEVREPRQILLEDGDIPEIRTDNTWFINFYGVRDETWICHMWVDVEVTEPSKSSA